MPTNSFGNLALKVNYFSFFCFGEINNCKYPLLKLKVYMFNSSDKYGRAAELYSHFLCHCE